VPCANIVWYHLEYPAFAVYSLYLPAGARLPPVFSSFFGSLSFFFFRKKKKEMNEKENMSIFPLYIHLTQIFFARG